MHDARTGGGWQYMIITALLLILSLSPIAGPRAQTTGSDAAASDTAADAKLQALVEVLQDEQARTALIDRLTALANAEESPAEPDAPLKSATRQFAELTRDVAEETSALTGRVWRDIEGLGDVIGTGRFDLPQLIETNTPLIGIVAATIAALMILRLLRRPLVSRIADRAVESGTLGAALWLLLWLLIEVVTVLLAFGCGYVLALGIFGETGRIGVDQSLFLNGFLVVELIKTLLRAAISPGWAQLRFLPISDVTAGFAYRRSALIAAIIGYGVLVVSPLATTAVSLPFGRAVGVLAMVTALALTLFGIWMLRALLARDAALSGSEDDLTGRALTLLDRLWPWLASLYATGMFAVAVSRPAAVLPYVLGATARSFLAIVVGVALVILIGRVIKRGVPLPAKLRTDLPQLGRRLNRLVPTFLRGLRLIVLIGVVLSVIDAWQILDIGGWMTSSGGEVLLGAVASALIVAVVAYLIWLGSMSWIEYRLSGGNGHFAGARERTLLSLLGNAFTIVVAIIASMLVLSELGINIGPLLAGAGVLGLAIGFGAQKLVQDIITGVFIQFENAINTGDVITVAGTTGVVERLSVRSIGIRDVAGTYHLIPFSAVDAVANFNRGFAFHVAEVGIAYKESVSDAKVAMGVAFERLRESEFGQHVLSDLEMHGVTALGDSAVVIRARIRTAPGQQWAVGRAYNELVKEVFDERGIDIPFPHMTVYMGADKEGKTQLDGFTPVPA